MKEQIWLTNIKYLRLPTLHLIGISIFIYKNEYTISEDIIINKKKELCGCQTH